MLAAQVIWITGLSGAGKTTFANLLTQLFRDRNLPVVMLDGDELRQVFGADVDYKDFHEINSRRKLAMQYANLCRIIATQGITVVIATISLFREVHKWNRLNLPGYFEVYLKVPIQELRRRDPKGIYRRFDEGILNNVAGLDLAIDEPEFPDLILDQVSRMSVSVQELYNSLSARE
jgi:cytidine diphosphoramidate kinase